MGLLRLVNWRRWPVGSYRFQANDRRRRAHGSPLRLTLRLEAS